MSVRENEVYEFFNNTRNYLYSNSSIFLRRKIIAELLGTISGKQIIDIGCGNGLVSNQYLKENHVTFLDLSEQMLHEAKKLVPVDLINNATFLNIPFEESSLRRNYDIVILIGVLAHVRDIREVITKISDITSRDSLCLVQITDKDRFIAKVLRGYSYLKRKITVSLYNRKPNYISKKDIIRLFSEYNYLLEEQRVYMPTFPGFRYLRYETRAKFLNSSYKNIFTAIIGSEVILKFRKTC